MARGGLQDLPSSVRRCCHSPPPPPPLHKPRWLQAALPFRCRENYCVLAVGHFSSNYQIIQVGYLVGVRFLCSRIKSSLVFHLVPSLLGTGSRSQQQLTLGVKVPLSLQDRSKTTHWRRISAFLGLDMYCSFGLRVAQSPKVHLRMTKWFFSGSRGQWLKAGIDSLAHTDI